MLRVALIGAQDTGKTTLARGLAAHFSTQGLIAEYVPEYAREFIGQYGALSNAELLVTLKQIEKELLVSAKADVMFTDSPILLSYVYTLLTGDITDPRLWVVLDTIQGMINRHPPYDLIIHLTPFRQPRADGIRSPLLIAQNDEIAHRIVGYLMLHNLPHTTLTDDNMDKRFYIAARLVSNLLGKENAQ